MHQKLREWGFGKVLRCYRLGFHWWDKGQCMVRVSDIHDGWAIEMQPPDGPVQAWGKRPSCHVCWWEGGQAVLDEVACLERLLPLQNYVRVRVDDEGVLVSREAP